MSLIMKSLSQAFLQPINILLLHSQSLEISQAIAIALSSCRLKLVLLVDLASTQLSEINYYLTNIRQQNLVSPNYQVIPISKSPKEKRQKYYLEGGVYALSSQIILVDLLTGCLHAGELSRVIIFHGASSEGKLCDKYCRVPWICTLLTMGCKQVPITLASSRVLEFTKQNLSTVVRLLFCKKVVIWPYGRSEIRASLKQVRTGILQKTYLLRMNRSEARIYEVLCTLEKYCTVGNKTTGNMPVLSDSRTIADLKSCLLNRSKIELLIRVTQVIHHHSQTPGSIWSSNNMSIMESIEELLKLAKASVYSLISTDDQKQEQTSKGRLINLSKLVRWHSNHEVPSKKLTVEGKEPGKSEQLKDQSITEGQGLPLDVQDDLLGPEMPYQLHFELFSQAFVAGSKWEHPMFSAKTTEILTSLHKLYCATQSQTACEQDRTSKYEFPRKTEVNQMAPRSQTPPESQNNQDSSSKRCLINHHQYPYISCCHESLNNKASRTEEVTEAAAGSGQGDKQTKKLSEFLFSGPVIRTHPITIITSSRQNSQNLHQEIHAHQNNSHYMQYIRKLLKYLSITRQERLKELRTIIRKIQKMNHLMEHKEEKQSKRQKQPLQSVRIANESILLEELYQQLSTVDEIVTHYENIMDNGSNQMTLLLDKELSLLEAQGKLRYVNPKQVKVYEHRQYRKMDDCVLTITNRHEDSRGNFINEDGSKIKLESTEQLEQTAVRVRLHIQSQTNLPEFSAHLRVLCPEICIFHHPSPTFARHLAIQCALSQAPSLQSMHVLAFEDSYETIELLNKAVVEEDNAFWKIGQARSSLGQYSQDPYLRIQQLQMDDDIARKQKMLNLTSCNGQHKLTDGVEQIKSNRSVLVDKRQFKSMLPSYLFHHGFVVVPVFLEAADYILSNDIGIQKKSVQTRDLHESLRSGRLSEQLKKMSIKFKRPYLLIECCDSSYFNQRELSYGVNATTGEKYQLNVRRQLLKLMKRFNKVRVVWSLSYLNSIEIIKQLKRNQGEPEVKRFASGIEQNEADEILAQEPSDMSQEGRQNQDKLIANRRTRPGEQNSKSIHLHADKWKQEAIKEERYDSE